MNNLPVMFGLSTIQLILSFLILILSCVLNRQRYFSPISYIPGPILGTFGTCFLLWEIYTAHMNETLAKLYKKQDT